MEHTLLAVAQGVLWCAIRCVADGVGKHKVVLKEVYTAGFRGAIRGVIQGIKGRPVCFYGMVKPQKMARFMGQSFTE